MKYNFSSIADCPLIKKFGKPTTDSNNYNCHGFEDSWWLPTTDPRCEKCPHILAMNGEEGDYK